MERIAILMLAIASRVSAQSTNSISSAYSLPAGNSASSVRQQQIAINRAGYVYGSSPLGNTSYFPTGVLGDALVQSDVAKFNAEYEVFNSLIAIDVEVITEALVSIHPRAGPKRINVRYR
jgi:hypothetical protein